MKLFHQGCELIRDILQSLGPFSPKARMPNGHSFSDTRARSKSLPRSIFHAMVWSTHEEDAISRYEY